MLEQGAGGEGFGFLGRFDGPPLKELDVTGVNSSNVVLMDVKSGRVIGDLNGEERIYPASMTKIMTAIVALEAFSDLDGEITLSDDIFYALDGQDATQAGFRPGESVRVRDLVYGGDVAVWGRVLSGIGRCGIWIGGGFCAKDEPEGEIHRNEKVPFYGLYRTP